MLVLFFSISEEIRSKITEFIPRVAMGDEQALSKIYELAGGRLLAFSLGIMRERQSAEDVLSESFIKVVRFAHKFRPGSNGYAWLCAIVKNTALNKIKSQKIHRCSDISELHFVSDGKDLQSDSNNRLIVENALNKLEPKERTVIWLKYYNEFTIREIAAELKLPRSTVSDVILRAEQKLKKLLDGGQK